MSNQENQSEECYPTERFFAKRITSMDSIEISVLNGNAIHSVSSACPALHCKAIGAVVVIFFFLSEHS
ncbi:MAG: hypothetical protein JJT78_04300 [Leptospira sp.]|nr:hypothetical protein [Leptospira sp.]